MFINLFKVIIIYLINYQYRYIFIDGKVLCLVLFVKILKIGKIS